MTREEAIIRIKDHIEIHRYYERNAVKIFEALAMAIKALEQTEQRWIPCSETVDIPDHEVLACDKRGEMIIGYLVYYGKQWICESETEILFNPVAWMEKPERYVERKQDEIN